MWARRALSDAAIRVVLRLLAGWERLCLRAGQALVYAFESFRLRVAGSARFTGLVGSGRSRTLRRGAPRLCGVDSGSGQHSLATSGLGGKARGLVSQGVGAGGGGVAALAAPTPGEKIRVCGGRQASVGSRALCFLRGRVRSGWKTHSCAEAGKRAWWWCAAADTHRRCHYARPHAARRCGQSARSLPGRGDSRICPPAHPGAGRNTAPDSGSL